MVTKMSAEEVGCITLHPGLQNVCLDPWVLETAYYSYRQHYGANAVEGATNEYVTLDILLIFCLYCLQFVGQEDFRTKSSGQEVKTLIWPVKNLDSGRGQPEKKADKTNKPDFQNNYDKSGNLNPVYSPVVDGNVLLILVTAQEGRTT